MSLAEALLRIPNSRTAGRLIRDKLMGMDWAAHRGGSDSIRVNASTWGLLLTGKYFDAGSGAAFAESRFAGKAVAQSLEKKMRQWGEPVIRAALSQALILMGQKFVLAETIESALEQSHANQLYSFDMLGEAAVCAADAERYYLDYQHAIEALAQGKPCASLNRSAVVVESPHAFHSVSIKLSALHSRFEISQLSTLLKELIPKVKSLALLAKRYGIGLTLDAETSASTEITLAVLTHLSREKDLDDWQGLGVCIQAYKTRAQALLNHCIELTKRSGRTLSVRLVKGAYWDSDIKWAQQLGLQCYPIYTQKSHTDCSYLLCAEQLLQASLDSNGLIYPQFASHNALTLSAVIERASDLNIDTAGYECQRLFGMGQALHQAIAQTHLQGIKTRVYAPVGPHKTLLAYLVRRMLENGANSSFVNQMHNPSVDIESLLHNPVMVAKNLNSDALPLPKDLYLPSRKNSIGENLWLYFERCQWQRFVQEEPLWRPEKSVAAQENSTAARTVVNPANSESMACLPMHSDSELEHFVGLLCEDLNEELADEADGSSPSSIDKITQLAKLLETHRKALALLCMRECGKTLADALDDIREAVDFCYYYAAQAERILTECVDRKTPEPLGLVICISPWNFPVAIFVGQVSAALAAGNRVLAKPAGAASLTACYLLTLFRAAGFSKHEFQLALCTPAQMRGVLGDERIGGVLFTGAEITANSIRQYLCLKKSTLPVLVAETGGQNAMIVDSSALLEQVVGDIIRSSFNAAGQRCSALRVLYVQSDIFDDVIEKLMGAVAELRVGEPSNLDTDIGPVIDRAAWQMLHQHCQALDKNREQATLLYRGELPKYLPKGNYFSPCIYEIAQQNILTEEVFGPVLHVIRYDEFELPTVIDSINACGFGLTLGIHSRIESTHDFICARARVGNIYINRNQVGAVVGSQPFGGMGRSGTGPKAGGPNYVSALLRWPKKCVSSPSILMDIAVEQGHFNSSNAARSARIFDTAAIARRIEALDKLALMLHEDVYTLARDNRSAAFFLHCVGELQRQALSSLLEGKLLPSVAGESNQIRLLARGRVLIICRDSLLVGEWWLQVLAALVAGNQIDVWVPSLSLAAVNSGLNLLRTSGFDAECWQVYELSDGLSSPENIDAEICWSAIVDHPESPHHLALATQLLNCTPIVPILAEAFSARYLSTFCVEQVISTDTSAFGGNIELLNSADKQ